MLPGRAKSLPLRRAWDGVVSLSFLTTHLQAHYLVAAQHWSQRPKGKQGEWVPGFASGGWASSFLNVSLCLCLNSVVKCFASKVIEWLLIRDKRGKWFNWLFKNKILYIKSHWDDVCLYKWDSVGFSTGTLPLRLAIPIQNPLFTTCYWQQRESWW